MAESKATPKTEAAQSCSVESCKRPYRAKGYCVTHYKLWRRGEIEAHRARYKICSKEACRKQAIMHGLCEEHRPKKAVEGEAAAS